VFWAWILAIVAISVIARGRRLHPAPDAISRAGTIGPEFVQEDT
jgi:hypothetical protein